MGPLHPWPTAAVAAGLVLAAAPTSPAQQAGPDRSCTLTLQPTDSTESVSRKVAEDTYVTHIRNGMRWLCDPATMTADSAVQYEARQTVVMIGSVHYRDTIRDLRSRRLTYYERDDRVLAEDSVRLRQLKTGSVLRAPRVEFYNAVRGDGRTQTVATRRPRMRTPAPGDTTGDPFRVVADTTVLFGERRTTARGDVVVRREDLTARGGFARFRVSEGTGFLTRSPSVRGRDFRLTGDTIHVRFAGSELRSVRAVGHGHLTGEEVDVRAPRVDIRVAGEQVDELWAYADSARSGAARALSAEQEIHGDSLHFSFGAGSLTRIAAVGRALAMEVLPEDTAGAGARDSVATPPDTIPEPGPPADPVPASDSAAGDSAASPGPSPRPAPGPGRNWIGGDTVRATFSAAGPPSPAPSGTDSAGPGADSIAAAPQGRTVAADTAREGGEAAGDTTSAAPGRRTRIQKLVAVGDARSFYLIPREEGAEGAPGETSGGGGGERLARNYVIGDRITVRFRSGRPLSVHGVRAIGLFLEPVEGEGAPGGAAASDTAAAGAAGDTTAAGETSGRGAGGPGADTPAAPDTARASGPPRRARPAAEARSGARGTAGSRRRDLPPRQGRHGTLRRATGSTRTDGMIYE